MEKNTDNYLTADELNSVVSRNELLALLDSKQIASLKEKTNLNYEAELRKLQVELVKMQNWARENKKRIVILFEGRDAAGKGGAIRRFIEHLNPRSMRVVALNKPTEEEKGQWYFTRYIKELPNPGEVVFFDRSWYNRAVVEPVMGFCSNKQYEKFMRQVSEIEHLLYEDGVIIIKLWFSVSKEIQSKRFASRKETALKQWKISPVDEQATKLWDKYTRYKEAMFSRSHTTYSPWVIVNSNNKKIARLESIRYVLSVLEYDGKLDAGNLINPDPTIVGKYYRSIEQVDF